MNDWMAVGALAMFLAASTASFARLRGLRRGHDVLFALKAGAVDAMARRHAIVTIEHLTLALLFDGELAAMVRAAGGNPANARHRLDDQLRPFTERGVAKADYEREVIDVLRSARGTRPVATARDVLVAIARQPDPAVSAILPDAMTLARARVRTMRGIVDCDRAPSAYRGVDAFVGDTRIRLFDDRTTTVAHVQSMLTTTFALGDACARYVTLRVHELGSAAVGPWPRAEAERLATKAREDARAHGYPLRVAIESA